MQFSQNLNSFSVPAPNCVPDTSSPADAPFQHAAADLAPAAAFEAPGPAAPVAAGPVILVLDGSVKGAGKGRERGPVCWWLVP